MLKLFGKKLVLGYQVSTNTMIKQLVNQNLKTQLFTNRINMKTNNVGRVLQDLKQNKIKLNESTLQDDIATLIKNGVYNFISKQDFLSLIFDYQNQQITRLFLTKDFFNQNTHFLNIKEIIKIINLVQQDPSQQFMLELIPYTYYFASPNPDQPKFQFFNQQQFEKFYQSIQPQYKLSCLYHFYHLNVHSNIIKIPMFTSVIPQIADAQTQIYNLLQLKYKLANNTKLQLYLADLFFGSSSFEEAILSLQIIVLLLARIAQGIPQISDLITLFKQKFGEEKYDFYVGQEIQKCLEGQFLKTYEQGLENAKKTAPTVFNLTELDRLIQLPQIKDQKHTIDRGELSYEEIQQKLGQMEAYNNIEQNFIFKNMKQELLFKMGQMRGMKTQSKQFLTSFHKYFFSSNQQDGKDEEQSQSDIQQGQGGFLLYLKKAKQIEEQQQQTTFLSQKEIGQLKEALKKDNKNLKRAQSRSVGDKQSFFQRIDKFVSPQQQSQFIQPESKFISKEEQQLNEKIQQAQNILDPILLRETTNSNKVKALKDVMVKGDQILVGELVKNLKSMPVGDIIFWHLFLQGEKEKQNMVLNLRVQSEHGEIEKEYYQYYQSGCMPYDIGESGYLYLLQSEYKRLRFKNILTHMAVHNAQVTDAIMYQIVDICKNKKIGQTLLEIGYLFIKGKNQLNSAQFQILIDGLTSFKNNEYEIIRYIGLALHNYKWEVQFNMIDKFLNRLIENDQMELCLNLYESIKDGIVNRKHQNENKTISIENDKKSLSKIIRQFCQTLINSEKIEQAKLIMNNAKILKYNFTQEDYLIWLKCYEYQPKETNLIFKELEKKLPDQVNLDHISAIYLMIMHQPVEQGYLLDQLYSKYIETNKIQLNDEFIQIAAKTYKRTREFMKFANFLKFAHRQNIKMSGYTKKLLYGVMNAATDDFEKSQIKGAIDLFFQSHQEQEKQVVKQKNQIESIQAENEDLAVKSESQGDIINKKKRVRLRLRKSVYLDEFIAAKEQQKQQIQVQAK